MSSPVLDFSSHSSTFSSPPATPTTASVDLEPMLHDEDDEPEMEKEDDKAYYPPKIEQKTFDMRTTDTNKLNNKELLQFLIQKSTVYASILSQRIDQQNAARVKLQERDEKAVANGKPMNRKRKREDEGPLIKKEELQEMKSCKRARDANGSRDTAVEEGPTAHEEEGEAVFEQSPLITGAKLRDYQLAGVQWLDTLYANGLNGILADEMGLGKTLQTIAFLAHLKSKGMWGPYLIVCPLSVLHNWTTEFEKFAPSIPTCMYHGTKEHRGELRRTVLRAPHLEQDEKRFVKPVKARKNMGGRKFTSGTKRKSTKDDDRLPPVAKEDFPVVITTYEMITRDSNYLSHLIPEQPWRFIVVDEGHRLKNMDCKLIRELKTYPSDHRLLLTGTPLHNNLAELWSLLNYILPEIFNDLSSFERWFNLPELTEETLSNDQSTNIIASLHAILKPFLLRRLKTDVETSIPPKKEYVLYAPLTHLQKDVYKQALNGGLRKYLIDQGMKGAQPDSRPVDVPDDKGGVQGVKSRSSMKGRRRTATNYVEEGDDEYFERVAQGETASMAESVEVLGREHQMKQALKKVNNMRLRNLVMQLRKICSHPYLFDWPLDESNQPALDEQLVNASGKMLLLNRLLDELFRRGHKALLFSQFTTMLDIIEDWAVEFKGWNICRIDGTTDQVTRRNEMERFNQAGDAPDAPKLFLLSTRAGGLGINLVAADTVIFYDMDWNPQMDLQAMDRAHRIGQTKPVLIFRLVSAHTVETKVLQRASEKRKLEALVIAKGKFKQLGSQPTKPKETMTDMAKELLNLEGEKIDVVSEKDMVISDAALEALLDRSPEVFAQRALGWTSAESERRASGKKTKNVAFEVFEQQTDEANEGLAHMMGEDERGREAM